MEALLTFDQVANDCGYVLRFGRFDWMGFASKHARLIRAKAPVLLRTYLSTQLGRWLPRAWPSSRSAGLQNSQPRLDRFDDILVAELTIRRVLIWV